jgi:signal transduction histidine kinase
MSVEQIRELDRAKRLMAMGQMAASLAHEIRNPLGSMELYCTLLKKDLVGQPGSLELAEQIHSGIRILDRIINNCLQFARDLVPRAKQLDDTRELFKEVRECLEHKADEAGAQLIFEERGNNEIYADPYLVSQALLNVVINALDASREKNIGSAALNGSRPVVRVFSDRLRDSAWVLSVSDSGPGITAQDQEKVFDPFFTTKKGGTGLGLAIVHSIASAHRGTVSIQSEMGRGTTVIMEFPAQVGRQ